MERRCHDAVMHRWLMGALRPFAVGARDARREIIPGSYLRPGRWDLAGFSIIAFFLGRSEGCGRRWRFPTSGVPLVHAKVIIN